MDNQVYTTGSDVSGEMPTVNSPLKNIWDKIRSNRRLFGFLALLLVVAAVPLTVFVAQQNQDNRQRASGPQTALAMTGITLNPPNAPVNQATIITLNGVTGTDKVKMKFCDTQNKCFSNDFISPNWNWGWSPNLNIPDIDLLRKEGCLTATPAYYFGSDGQGIAWLNPPSYQLCFSPASTPPPAPPIELSINGSTDSTVQVTTNSQPMIKWSAGNTFYNSCKGSWLPPSQTMALSGTFNNHYSSFESSPGGLNITVTCISGIPGDNRQSSKSIQIVGVAPTATPTPLPIILTIVPSNPTATDTISLSLKNVPTNIPAIFGQLQTGKTDYRLGAMQKDTNTNEWNYTWSPSEAIGARTVGCHPINFMNGTPASGGNEIPGAVKQICFVAPTSIPTPTPTHIPTATSTPVPNSIKGDINGDGKVDLLDFNAWKDAFLR